MWKSIGSAQLVRTLPNKTEDNDEDKDDVEGEAKLSRALLSNGSSSRLETGRGGALAGRRSIFINV